jgi:glycosyltransferase involved in cell wall biosynthesis
VKVGVFHPGTQHSWQTALALQQLGRLEWYATSIFHQPDRWPYRLSRAMPGPLARRMDAEFRRFSHPGLDPALVRTVGLAEWAERIAARAGLRGWAQRIDAWGNRCFVTQLAAEIASPRPFALWGYSASALTSFELGQRHGRTRILDRTNGDFRIYNAMMAEVRERYGEWFLPVEREVPAAQIATDQREYELADAILVGSPFAAETIRQATSDPAIAAKLRVLEYCFDEAFYAGLPPPAPVSRTRPVKFLWVGLVIPRKGIHHVLEAFARLPRGSAELTIVGDLKVPRKAFAPYADQVTYIPTVARADVPAIMAAHDVFVLPSYFEGAGITLYEALAAGCALIQSDRCTPAVTPETGIQIGAPTTEAVYQAMLTAVEDRDRLDGWRAAAQGESRKHSFANYRANIAALLDELGI